jgi:hypothetical protein
MDAFWGPAIVAVLLILPARAGIDAMRLIFKKRKEKLALIRLRVNP